MNATEQTHKIIRANSSHRFQINRFHVTAELLGASHEFPFKGEAITIEIPLQDSAHVRCYKWRTDGNVPLEYQIERITLRIAKD